MSKSEHSGQTDAVQSQFPVFARALRKYFPNKAEDFLDKYHAVGESSIEFGGLSDEIVNGINAPSEAATFLNDALGTNFTADEAEQHLIEMHDQLTRSGIYSQEHAEAERERVNAAKPTSDELFDYYLKRRIQLNGPLARFSAPLWVYPVASATVALLGAGLLAITSGTFIGPVAHWICLAIILIAVGILFASAIAMYMLRAERLDPDKEARRDEAFQKSKEEKAAKRPSTFLNRVNPFN